MTPGARVQAAIDCLGPILAGRPAEQVLTTWGRQSRFAGSGDRAAVRDHVYAALRRRRSSAWIGGGEGARAVMIGSLMQDGADLAALFSGQGHAPAPLMADEWQGDLAAAPPAVQADLPDWLWEMLLADHGPQAAGIAAALRQRAPVWLRANLARGSRDSAAAALAAEGIATRPHPDVATALEVTGNAGKIQSSTAFARGLVELQDASSQAAVLRLPLGPGQRVLDYCAGGGGKALAIAALTRGPVLAHDADPRRMADLPARAARAGAPIERVAQPSGAFDLVLADAPCSGSGTWRRTPDAKARLTPAGLGDLVALQAAILARAAGLVAPGGVLAYATCSVLSAENDSQIKDFRGRHPGWQVEDRMQRLPDALGDGFYLAVLRRTGDNH